MVKERKLHAEHRCGTVLRVQACCELSASLVVSVVLHLLLVLQDGKPPCVILHNSIAPGGQAMCIGTIVRRAQLCSSSTVGPSTRLALSPSMHSVPGSR